MSNSGPRVGVIQDGARLHYGVPLAARRAGLLSRVLTDWYAGPQSLARLAAVAVGLVKPAVCRRLRERYHPGLDGVPVVVSPLRAVLRRRAKRRFPTSEAFFAWEAERFADWALAGGRLDGLDVLVGFVRNLHPKLIEGAAGRGLAVVGDQIIAPAAVEAAAAAVEAARWPGWEPPAADHDFALVADLERRSWAALSHITCGSDYVRTGLLSAGVPSTKVTVLRYPDAPAPLPPNRCGRAGPVTVGFVGSVGLRKGSPYFFQVAKRFNQKKVRFVMVGPIHLNPAVATREKGPVELTGSVPRSAVRGWLEAFDVFLFPSTCEGSAGAVVEALGAGLPVVTTPQSGTAVRDGIDGFVIEDPRDIDALADRVRRLIDDPELRAEMGRSAYERHAVHHPDRYAEGLAAVVRAAAGGGAA